MPKTVAEVMSEPARPSDLTELSTESKSAPNRGLTGTDLQVEIIKTAKRNPTMTVAQLAVDVGSDERYVASVLRRADPVRWIDVVDGE